MALRLLSAAVGIPLIVAAVWFGHVWLFTLVMLVALLGLAEFYRLAGATGARPAAVLGAGWVLFAVCVGPTFVGQEINPGNISVSPQVYLAGMGIGLMASAGWFLFARRSLTARDAVVSWAFTVAGVLYLGLLSYALLLRYVGDGPDYTGGRAWLLLAVVTTFATDTGAFFAGRLLGKRPLAPAVSPHKTQEGAVAGFVCAIGAAMAVGAVLDAPAPVWVQAVIGLAVGVVAQLGDLVESLLKRAAGAKEASGLVPGHGGILDRLDSLLFAIPVVYYLVVLLTEV